MIEQLSQIFGNFRRVFDDRTGRLSVRQDRALIISNFYSHFLGPMQANETLIVESKWSWEIVLHTRTLLWKKFLKICYTIKETVFF